MSVLVPAGLRQAARSTCISGFDYYMVFNVAVYTFTSSSRDRSVDDIKENMHIWYDVLGIPQYKAYYICKVAKQSILLPLPPA